jgi:hypothetical protein
LFTIEVLNIRRDMEDTHVGPFEEMVAVRNAAETQILGSDVLSHSAVELLPGFRNEHKPGRLFVARMDGRIVARAVFVARPAGSSGLL